MRPLLGLPDSLFVSFVIFCENVCVGALLRDLVPEGQASRKPLASNLRVLCVSVVNILGVVGFIGGSFLG